MWLKEILAPIFVSGCVLLLMAYLTYFERRMIGAIQLRLGPNRVGPYGLLQPIADAIKLIAKSHMEPQQSQKTLFILAPVISFFTSMIVWAFIPVGIDGSCSSSTLGILWIMMISACHVYGLLFAGWASQSKYALLGALRASAQVISYELALSIVILCIVMVSGSMDLQAIIRLQDATLTPGAHWNCVSYFPLFILYMICIIAESHRAPFDIAEGESELVAGYHVEYGGWGFALFFLAEYIQMIVGSVLGVCLFMGGAHHMWKVGWLADHSLIWFVVKTSCLLWIFIHARATFPRYRYDQLMILGWTALIPASLLGFLIVSAIVGVL